MDGGIGLTNWEAIILGAVQGLTEFLPISSSAHLAIAQDWLGLPPDQLPMHVFDGVSHIGTVLAIFVVFFGTFRAYCLRLLEELRPNHTRTRFALRITALGVFASIPTAVIGIAFKKYFEESFGNPFEVGMGLVITGILLMITSWIARGRKGWKKFTWWHAVLIGVAQGISISPGISRSGATICTATFLGIRRRWAAEFSFFIAIPAIVGATILKLREAFVEHSESLASINWGPTMMGGLVAFVLGVVSLRLLLGTVRRAKLHLFAWYCWLVGLAVIVMR